MRSSEFAECLKSLLDDTNLFDRKSWAKLLHRSEANIQEWLDGRSQPPASCLNMIYVTLERASDVSQEPVRRFEKMAHKSARDISYSLGIFMLPTVWEYMKRPMFCDLNNKLAKLKSWEQVNLLNKLYPIEPYEIEDTPET